MKRIPRIVGSLTAGLLGLSMVAITSANGAGGVGDPAFYVDGQLYRTVGTPTDFSNTGAPAHSFDTLYAIEGQAKVAEAGPGQPGFDGGRWMVRPVMFNSSYEATVATHDTNGSGNLDSNEEVEAALADSSPSGVTLGDVVRYLECPVIKVPPKS
jgi:hypothetical protein